MTLGTGIEPKPLVEGERSHHCATPAPQFVICET